MNIIPADDDPFPVNGKHFGIDYESVPASYLDWLSDQPWLEHKYPAVKRYIDYNRKQIDEELDDTDSR